MYLNGNFILGKTRHFTDKVKVLISNQKTISAVQLLYSESSEASIVVNGRPINRSHVGAISVHNLYHVTCKQKYALQNLMLGTSH